MSISDDTMRELGMFSQGRSPAWVELAVETEPPSDATDGVATNDAIITQFMVRFREDPATQQTDVTVVTVDATATYTITLGGVGHAYDASTGVGDEAAILAGLAAIVAVSPNYAAAVVGTAVIITRTADATQYTVAVSAGGAGVLAAVYDGEAVDYTVRAYAFGTWVVIYTESLAAFLNQAVRALTAGYTRVHVQLANIPTDERVVAFAGPCGFES